MITSSKQVDGTEPANRCDAEKIGPDERFDIGLAIREYTDEAEAYTEAEKRFKRVCDRLRGLLGKNRTVVAQVGMRAYLVRTDRQGNLDVQTIEWV